MSVPNRYQDDFRLLNNYCKKRTFKVAAAVAIAFGDALIIGGNAGYISLATTLQGNILFKGVANSANTAAEANADGDEDVEVIPPLPEYDFMVPCEATGVIAQTDVGLIYDLQTEDGIDEADLVTFGFGFHIDAIDISSAAVAANTNGYAIGHFEYLAAS